MKEKFLHFGHIVLLFVAVLAVFWFNGSSASRKTVTNDPHVSTGGYVPDPENGNTVGNTQQKPPSTTGQGGTVTPPDVPVDPPTDPEKEAFDAFLSGLDTTASAADKGYTLPQYVYGEGVQLVYDAKLGGLTDTLQPIKVDVLRIKHLFVPGVAEFTTSNKFIKMPSLMLYGGLLLAHNEDKQYILDPILGEVAFNASGYALAYAKDAENRALFFKDGGYYYFNELLGDMTLTSAPRARELYFDYTPDYAVNHFGLTPFMDEETKLWGYMGADGKVAIKAQYYRAFSFSANGIAVVQKNKLDGLLFINTAGKVVLDTHLQYYTYNGGLAYDWYRAPDDLTEKSLGMLYFDHGYMRVIVQTYSLSNSTEVLWTREMIIDETGKPLSMPSDYNIIAYSDGVVLLEKNGRYGYYSHKGHWIVAPIYTSANAFAGGVGVCVDVNGKYYAFDTNGNEVIPGVFDYISSFSMGKMLGYKKEEGWMIFSLYAMAENTEDTKEDTVTE